MVRIRGVGVRVGVVGVRGRGCGGQGLVGVRGHKGMVWSGGSGVVGIRGGKGMVRSGGSGVVGVRG